MAQSFATGDMLVARRSGWRWVLAGAAVVAAAAHTPVILPHLDEAPYMGVLFVVLTWACLFLGAAAARSDDAIVYELAILTGGLAILGYVATRLVAFPQLADDVGNWLEPLGVVSVLAEATVVIAAVCALSRRPVAPQSRQLPAVGSESRGALRSSAQSGAAGSPPGSCTSGCVQPSLGRGER